MFEIVLVCFYPICCMWALRIGDDQSINQSYTELCVNCWKISKYWSQKISKKL